MRLTVAEYLGLDPTADLANTNGASTAVRRDQGELVRPWLMAFSLVCAATVGVVLTR